MYGVHVRFWPTVYIRQKVCLTLPNHCDTQVEVRHEVVVTRVGLAVTIKIYIHIYIYIYTEVVVTRVGLAITIYLYLYTYGV